MFEDKTEYFFPNQYHPMADKVYRKSNSILKFLDATHVLLENLVGKCTRGTKIPCSFLKSSSFKQL